MIPKQETKQEINYGVPRTRGDDPMGVDSDGNLWVCSPHTRG